MDLERRLREQLKTEARQVEASPDAWARVRSRLGRRAVTPRRLILVLGTAAAVALGVWIVSSQTTVKQNVFGTPAPDTFFEGYWPVTTTREALDMQRRVDDGQDAWRRDAAQVAIRYATRSLGWTVVADTDSAQIRGSATDGWLTEMPITPQIGEGAIQQPGAQHVVTLIGLKGAEKPAWFVSRIDSQNITVDEPQSTDKVRSPLTVSGTGLTFEGNIVVTIVEDAGRKLGQGPVTAGGSERTPFEGTINFSSPSSKAGIVLFEGGNGLGGPSTDLTIVRVRFAKPDQLKQPTPTAAVDRSASPTEPDEAVHCFLDGRSDRDLEVAKRCMTDRYIAQTDKNEFECCSSPWFDHAVIIKSYMQNDRLVYDTVIYWRTSAELSSDGSNLYLVRDGEHWLVDDWKQGPLQRVDNPTSVTFSFLALGDTPTCDENGQPTSDSFVPISRDVPSGTGAEIAITVVREMLTGPWGREDDGVSPFPTGTRVESVDVSGNEVHVNLTDTEYRPSAACDYAQVALQKTIRTLPGFENANITFSTP